MASQTPTKPTGAAKLRELLKDPKHVVVAPGVYDGLTARLALAQDFECLYMVCVFSSPSLPIAISVFSVSYLQIYFQV